MLTQGMSFEAIVETSSSWPWLHEVLSSAGITFVLAHAKKLRAISEASSKSDVIDATLLARMQLARLIPAVYATPKAQREWATLLRHRTEAFAVLTPEERRLCRTHLRLIVHLTQLIRALDRRITQVAGPIPEAALLRTIPGIGDHRSLVVCAETQYYLALKARIGWQAARIATAGKLARDARDATHEQIMVQ